MKALIEPNKDVNYISAWVGDSPVFGILENSQRVAQVEESEFEVATPLFWVDCDASAVADEWYYDTSDSTVKVIPHVEKPII